MRVIPLFSRPQAGLAAFSNPKIDTVLVYLLVFLVLQYPHSYCTNPRLVIAKSEESPSDSPAELEDRRESVV